MESAETLGLNRNMSKIKTQVRKKERKTKTKKKGGENCIFGESDFSPPRIFQELEKTENKLTVSLSRCQFHVQF